MNVLNLFKGWKGESGLTEKGIQGTTILGNIANIGLQKLGNGNRSGVGDLVSSIGGVIPGPWGIAAQGAGHLINAAFGSNINQGAVENYMSDISRLENAEYNAGNYKSLLQQKRALGNVNIDKDNLGTQGWLSSKLDSTYSDLNNQLLKAEAQNRLAFNLQAEDINENILNSAYSNLMKKGGRIHIEEKSSPSTAVRKRAVFTDNARRWHSLGGNLFEAGGLMHQHGGIFSNGVVTIGNGGTHEQNPFDGVQIGLDPQGVPNMVEEGEVIWNDYVFSNRLKPTQEFKDKYKVKGNTFADVAKEMQKESEERPNDPISKNGLEDSLTKLMIEQEKVRELESTDNSNNMFDKGGKKKSKTKNSEIEGLLKSVTEHDYYVNTLGYPTVKKGKDIEKHKKLDKALGYQEDIPDMDFVESFINTLFDGKKEYKTGSKARKNKFDVGGPKVPFMHNGKTISDYEFKKRLKDGTAQVSEEYKSKPFNTKGLRYAPAIDALTGFVGDTLNISNTPDFTSSRMVGDALSRITPVGYTPINEYMAYTPMDVNFYSNKLMADSAAARRGIANQGINPGMVNAGILAASNNAQTQLANLARTAEEHKQNQREKIATFNKGTKAIDAEGFLKADLTNKQAEELMFRGVLSQAQLYDKAMATPNAARANNRQAFFDTLGNIGKEAFVMDMIQKNPALLYDWFGQYKGANTGAYGGYLTIKNKKRRK